MDVLEICVKDNLQQHAWCEAACAATFICGFDCADVEMLDYGIQDAHRSIFRDKVTDTVRKKKIIVLIVRFICYLSMSRGRIAVIAEACPPPRTWARPLKNYTKDIVS